jgi:hypothetical protein
MGRTRDVSKILTSNTSILTLASASSTYQTIAKTGLIEITPSTISVTGGSGSVSSTGVVSFTSASVVSLNDVFSTTYDKYRVLINVKPSSNGNKTLRLRARVGGVDTTSSVYSFANAGLNASNSTINTAGAGQTSAQIGQNFQYSDQSFPSHFDIINPFATEITFLQGEATESTLNDFFHTSYSAGIMHSTSYTGFTFFLSTGNMTGSVSVYGYNK